MSYYILYYRIIVYCIIVVWFFQVKKKRKKKSQSIKQTNKTLKLCFLETVTGQILQGTGGWGNSLAAEVPGVVGVQVSLISSWAYRWSCIFVPLSLVNNLQLTTTLLILKPWPSGLASRRKFAKPELDLRRVAKRIRKSARKSQKTVNFTYIIG